MGDVDADNDVVELEVGVLQLELDVPMFLMSLMPHAHTSDSTVGVHSSDQLNLCFACTLS